MIMVWKKRNVCALVLAALSAVGLTGAASHYFGEKDTFLPNEGRVVVIDAGHAAKEKYHIAFCRET